MPGEAKPTAEVNGVLWGTRSADWAQLQEGQCQPVYEAVLERLSVGPGTALLDAGCGAGMASQMAASRGARVTGVDASEALLAIARQRVPDGTFGCSDLETLPFADASFDAVTGFNSFQYAGNPGKALAEARRVTKPGGSRCDHDVGTARGHARGSAGRGPEATFARAAAGRSGAICAIE